MTNSDRTLIGILVDRSGSMESMKDDMSGGIAALIDGQKTAPGSCDVTLAQFDTEYDIVYRPRPIDRAPTYRLQPRGGTALLDGIGRFVTEIGGELARTREDRRPGKVLIVIVTDGDENSSKRWSLRAVHDLIVQQQQVYRWEFVFLGANIDSFSVARSFGIPSASTMDFAGANAPAAMASVSNYAAAYRATGAAAFTDDDRATAMDGK